MAKEINVLALVKGEEQYIFFFDDKNRTETLRMLGRYAANPDLSFSWYDAAVLSEKIRQSVPPTPTAPAATFPLASASRSTPRFQLPMPGETS